MKKNLLLGIALFASVAASAQTVTWPCTMSRADLTPDYSATVTGSETITAEDIVLGSEIGYLTTKPCDTKDGTGANYKFPDENVGMIGWQPIAGNVDGSEATADLAESAGAYLDFYVEETDINKDLSGLSSIEFDATKVGTDAIRLNVKLLGEGDSEVDSGWLIDEATAKSFGDEYTADYNADAKNKDNPWDPDANGYNPSRNDGSKGVSGGANATGISHVKITSFPSDLIASNPYALTLRIAIIKCANNKQLGIYNLTMNFSSSSDGISTIKSDNVSNVIYNVAGQQVDSNYKGLVIKNGKKMIQK